MDDTMYQSQPHLKRVLQSLSQCLVRIATDWKSYDLNIQHRSDMATRESPETTREREGDKRSLHVRTHIRYNMTMSSLCSNRNDLWLMWFWPFALAIGDDPVITMVLVAWGTRHAPARDPCLLLLLLALLSRQVKMAPSDNIAY